MSPPTIRQTITRLLDLIAPVRCPLCARKLGGSGSCAACHLPAQGLIRRELRADPRGPFLLLAGGPLRGPVRRLVHAHKYAADPGALRLLVAQTRRAPLADLRWDGLVPVPPHPVRARERGWDPVAPLASQLASELGLPLRRLLRRRRYTEPLTGKSRWQRRQIVRGAFSALPSAGCLLLVDDVATTLSTLLACRQTLLAAGARAVDLLVAARTPVRLARPRSPGIEGGVGVC